MVKKSAKRSVSRRDSTKGKTQVPYTALDFKKVDEVAQDFADHIEANFEKIAHILLEYESYEVVVDEVARTLDLLRNLAENKQYFKLRVGEIASFLPRNQPLYALTCFVLVPSLMAKEVYFRIPHSMKHFFPKLLAVLETQERFPNVTVSHLQRTDFLRERSALRVNPVSGETVPVTDVVIFTGNSTHADQLRFIFDNRTLFITNGSGHNPVIVSSNADLEKAIEAVLSLQLYNQGQDCAAPNAILVHAGVYSNFLRMLRDEIRTVRVGDYRDRVCRVGPISDPKDLVRIEEFLIDNREWLDPTTPGITRAYDAILEPTIVTKPLTAGGNYKEIFAPVILVQMYKQDADLESYFENPQYAQNAMYVTVYGTSVYIKKLVDRKVNGLVLHDKRSLLHNTHLHASGIERGTKPYGGLGYGASSISIGGVTTSKATLPQRDIYEQVMAPILKKKSAEKRGRADALCTDIKYKNIEKLLRLKVGGDDTTGGDADFSSSYLDIKSFSSEKGRFIELDERFVHRILSAPNTDVISALSLSEIENIRALRVLLAKKALDIEKLKLSLYSIPKRARVSEAKNRENQQKFFKIIYLLLFGKDSGPRLPEFLFGVDRNKVCELLDI